MVLIPPVLPTHRSVISSPTFRTARSVETRRVRGDLVCLPPADLTYFVNWVEAPPYGLHYNAILFRCRDVQIMPLFVRFFFVSVCSVLFDCLQFPYAAGICSLPCHAGLVFKAGLEMALNLKHPKIRVATFLEFLETWKCRRIRRRCGKRFKVREKVGEFV